MLSMSPIMETSFNVTFTIIDPTESVKIDTVDDVKMKCYGDQNYIEIDDFEILTTNKYKCFIINSNNK